MKTETNGWELMAKCLPSDKFDCRYTGNCATQLELHRSAIERFLKIASLDGRVLVVDTFSDRFRACPDINPDGSTMGKGKLRWGEKPTTNPAANRCSLVYPDSRGWALAVNGDLIREKVIEQTHGNIKASDVLFAKTLNQSLQLGLEEILLRDKFTFTKDPFLTGRLITSVGLTWNYSNLLINKDRGSALVAAFLLFVMAGENILHKDKNEQDLEVAKKCSIPTFHPSIIANWHRRTVNHRWEALALPLEIDRTIIASGYLLGQKIKRSPLVRLAH